MQALILNSISLFELYTSIHVVISTDTKLRLLVRKQLYDYIFYRLIVIDGLKAMDIKVIGQTIPNHYFDHENLEDYKNFPIVKEPKCDIPAPNASPCNKAFFDITTLFAYVAEVTNAGCHRDFKV